MFRLLRRVFLGIKSMKYATTVALFLVLIAGLTTILSPQPILAQEEKIGLSLSLVSGRYYTEVTAGENVTLFLEVRNTGNKTITNIRLSSIKTKGWVVTFKPGTIDYLSPENFQTLEVNIKPGDKTAEGNYKVTLVADASETRRVLDIWLTVEVPEGYWLWIGGIILLVVVAGFIIVYLRFGRE
ncbi:NEW3 domain-containing protein [Chloroflexota bacterium]